MSNLFSQYKQWLRQKLPTEQALKNHRSLRFLHKHLHHNHLWRFDRSSVPCALLIGIFMSFMPMPFQMIPAAILAVICRANLILSVALVWISNVFTMPFMLLGCYHLGKWLLNSQAPELTQFSFEYLFAQLQWIWAPLLLGSIVAGLAFGILAYLMAKLIYWFY